MDLPKGKIIAVVGSVGSGKSTLVRDLAKHFEVTAFFEGEEEDFPDFVKKNIASGKNGMQTQLHFFSRAINAHIDALEVSAKGTDVVMDTFWLSNRFFLNSALENEIEHHLFNEMLAWADRMFPQPDMTFVLDASNDLLSQRISERDRSFESGSEKIAKKIAQEYRAYFSNPKNIEKHNAIIVDAASIDPISIGARAKLAVRGTIE